VATRMTLTALPLTSAGRFWPLGPFGIAILPVSCALSHVLNGHHGRSAFVRLTLYMNGDHLVRVSFDLFETPLLCDLSPLIGAKFSLWHAGASMLPAKHIGVRTRVR
jgi:hypothetical protein